MAVLRINLCKHLAALLHSNKKKRKEQSPYFTEPLSVPLNFLLDILWELKVYMCV